ncbi:MAG: hypothetical protein H0Z37_05465 [Firmicutes bacterium]|nr:hypothetical protein [Bacillota bacterium]
MAWQWVILVLGLAWGVQSVLAYRQIRHVRQAVADIQRRYRAGYMGVGTFRRPGKPGAMVILVADPAGRIVEGHRLAGFSVFARLQDYPAVRDWNVAEMAQRLDNGPWEGGAALREATRTALERIFDEMVKGRGEEAKSLASGV